MAKLALKNADMRFPCEHLLPAYIGTVEAR